MRKQVELRLALLAFKRTYNKQWMLGARGETPTTFERRCIPPERRCSSVAYGQHAPSSRLVRRAPHRSRCYAGFHHELLEKYDHRSRQWFEGNNFYDSGEPTPCCNNLPCSPREFNPIRERFRLTPLIGVISLESIYPLRQRVSARRVRDE